MSHWCLASDLVFIGIFSLCGTGDGNQALMYAGQVLTTELHPHPFLINFSF
jgi:hypothetical protein